MKSLTRIATAALLVLPSAADVRVGEAFPDLRLPTIDGGTLSLSSLRGRKLLLIEFASW